MSRPIKKFSLEGNALNLNADLSLSLKENLSFLDRHEGFSLQVLTLSNDAPHNGEMHPDGDEFIYVLSGQLAIKLESEPEHLISLGRNEGLVIPKGVWHKVHVVELAHIVTLSPGPGFEFRDLN